MKRISILLLLVCVGQAPVSAQLWSGTVDSSRAVDWSSAGVPGGIPNQTVQCGATINPSGDTSGAADVAAVNAAIQACAGSPNTFVQLGVGTFYSCGGFTFGSPNNANGYTTIVNNVTLRGNGPLNTIVKVICQGAQELGGAANAVSFAGKTTYFPQGTYTVGHSWTAGYAKGSTLLTLDSVSSLTAGMVVILDQRNSSIGLLGCTAVSTTATCTTSINHNYTVNPDPTQSGTPSGHLCPDNLTDCVFVGDVTGGGITAATLGAAGTGYSVNDILTLVQTSASGGQIKVLTLGAGNSIATFSIQTPGSGYLGGNGLAVTGGTGTGATFNVTGFGNCGANSCYNSGNNGIGTFSAPITATTSNTFSYALTVAPSGGSRSSVGFSDVDTGGVWVTNIQHGTTDETSTGNGRNCPDALSPACSGSEISWRSQHEVKKIVTVCTGSGTPVGACQNATQVILDSGLYHNNWATSQAPGLYTMDTTGALNVVTNAAGGTGYLANDTVTLVQAGGSGGQVKVLTVNSGAILTYSISASNGSGYHVANGLTVTGGHGTGATFNITNVGGNYLLGDGLESMTIDGFNDGGSDTNSLVEFYRAYGSWVKNVRFLSGDRNAIWIRDGSAHLQIQDSYVTLGKGASSSSYGFEPLGQVSDLLFANNIFTHLPAGLMIGGCSGCVFAYNYFADDGYSTVGTLQSMSDNGHDFQGYNLVEGQDIPTLHESNVHGTMTGPTTFFRNRARGQTPGGPIKTAGLNAIQVSANNRGFNFIGNVLGWPNNTAQAGGSIAGGQTAYWGVVQSVGNLIFYLDKTAENSTFVANDPLVHKSSFCWGNWDVVTGPASGAQWAASNTTGQGCNGTSSAATIEVPGAFTALGAQAVPVSHTLPASFYYASQPAFWATTWGTPKWPAIGPDVTGGTAPDGILSGPGLGMADSIPSQLAANNLPLDTSYFTPNTITGMTYSATLPAQMTLNGTFSSQLYDTFRVSGMTTTGFTNLTGGNGIYEIYSSNGPVTPFQPGVVVKAGTSNPAGHYYVTVTRVSARGETLAAPLTTVTLTNTNGNFDVTSPVSTAIFNGLNPGGCVGTACTVATNYNVYASVSGNPSKRCLQGSAAIGATYHQTTALVVAPCTTPPLVNTATATSITVLLTTSPGTFVSGGTMQSPLVLAFDGLNYYQSPVVPPVPSYACGLPGVSSVLCPFFTGTGIVPFPNPIPAWGPHSTTAAGGDPYQMQKVGNLTGSGTSVTPSDFNRPMILCTDSTFFGGVLLGFEDNGEANLFASDDSLLIIKQNGGIRNLASIDPNGNCSPVSGITYPGEVIFDHTSPTTTYSLQGVNTSQIYQDTLSITGCPSACVGTITAHVLLYDFANSQCLQNTFNGNPTWSRSGGSIGLFTDSQDDTTFSEMYSDTGIAGQKGRWTASWRKSYGPGRCDLWDANSGKYQSQSGTQGLVTIVNTPGDKFYIHEVFQTPNPAWVMVTTGASLMISGAYIDGYWGWQTGTANVVKCGSTGIGCSGHHADGFLNSIDGKNGTMHSYANPAVPLTNTTPNGAPCNDSHWSWNHNTTTDDYPVMVTAQDSQAPFNLATLQSAPPCPYYDEIYVGNSGTGNVLRLAHSFNLGWSWEFDAADGAVAQQSSSGKWAAFLTNGCGQFGSTNGDPNCNIGGPDWFKNDSTDYQIGANYGSFIMPVNGNPGHYVYHVQTCSGPCVSGATAPTWPQTATPNSGLTVVKTVTNLDDISIGWGDCSGACAGGNAPTAWLQSFGNPSPSRDGASMGLTISGNNYTDASKFYYTGASNNSNFFTLDTWFYVPTDVNLQAHEFDQFQYLLAGHSGAINNTRLYFGTECVTSGAQLGWAVWDSTLASWIFTGAPCAPPAATWHHLIETAHRVPGDVGCAGGYPHMYYDAIILDGVTAVSNWAQCAGPLPAGWVEQTGFTYQLGTNAACGTACTASMFIDSTTATLSTGAFDGTITWETYPDSQNPAVSAVSNCAPEVMLVKLFDALGIPVAPALSIFAKEMLKDVPLIGGNL